MTPVKLNLGCGTTYLPGYVNCDVLPHVRADRHFDLNTFPYPLETGCASEIFMDNVLEHLEDLPKVMTELHRLLQPGGVLKAIVPYAKADWAFQDPTHRHFFTETTLLYFTEGHPYAFYTECKFKARVARLVAHDTTWRHKLRNLIPGRSLLRFWFWNMYDVVYYELERP